MSCTTKISAGLNPSCEALDKIGGVDKVLYFGNLDDATFTLNEGGYIDGIILTSSPAAYLYKYIGKTKKHKTDNSLNVGENSNTWKQAIAAKLYTYFPEEIDSVDALVTADDLFAVVLMEDGRFMVYGYTKGIRAESAVDSSGVVIQDDTSMTVVISGEEAKYPKVLQLGAAIPGEDDYLTENIDALDAMSAD